MEALGPDLIVAGIGRLRRGDLCSFLAILEELDFRAIAMEAVGGVAGKLGYELEKAADKIERARDELVQSDASADVLRYRLWVRISEALDIPEPNLPPLSQRSARQWASAVGLRASERLTPSIVERRKTAREKTSEGDLAEKFGRQVARIWDDAKSMFSGRQLLTFPEIVQEGVLELLEDEDLVKKASEGLDPEMAAQLRQAQIGAQAALAAGGGWAMFAAVVVNSGFAPYILAAKASAWIPLVSGPGLVSLLATLVNPLTMLVGIGGIAWLGVGKGTQAARSQVAARLCVMLALTGMEGRETGLVTFLNAMRCLDEARKQELAFLSGTKRQELRKRQASMAILLSNVGLSASAIPECAGPPPVPWNRKRRRETDAQDALATGALTAGEMLWHAVAIDPTVISAADFSRATDLGDPFSFAWHAQEFLLRGSDISLRGYVAERLVMDQLVAQGHEVALAPLSNTPGLDLIVDGAPVQVKCGVTPELLREHFSKYPDIPVIANNALAELADGQPWGDLVTTLPGFEIDAIEGQISEALGHAIDLAAPDILEFALSIGLLRGGLELARGRVPLQDLPAWLLVDGASRGALAFAGGNLGGWVGLVAIGPAGAVILGPTFACAALLGNSAVKEGLDRFVLSRAWHAETIARGKALHQALVQVLDRKIERLQARVEALHAGFGKTDLEDWLVARAGDDLIQAIEDRLSLERPPSSTNDCFELLVTATALAPADAAVLRGARALRRQIDARPGLTEALRQMAESGAGWARAQKPG